MNKTVKPNFDTIMKNLNSLDDSELTEDLKKVLTEEITGIENFGEALFEYEDFDDFQNAFADITKDGE